MQDITLSSLIDYDIIFIGPLGAVVANLYRNRSPQFNRHSSKASNNSTNSNRLMVITNKKCITCPTLLPTHEPSIQIDHDLPKCIDQDTSQIYRILPHEQIIIMRQKKYYHYRYLVYGQSEEEWVNTDLVQNLSQSLNTKYSYVYSNLLKACPAYSQAQKILNKEKQWMKQIQSKLQKILMKRKSLQIQIQNHKKKQRRNRKSSNAIMTNNFNEQLHNQIESTTNFHRQETINIIFYIPNSRHNGYDNYNILYKCKSFIEYYRSVLKQKNVKQKQFKKYLSKIKETQVELVKQQIILWKKTEKEREPVSMVNQENIIENNNSKAHQIKNSSVFNENKEENTFFKAFAKKDTGRENQEPIEEDKGDEEEVLCCKKMNFIVLLEGESFFPHCSRADQFFKKQLAYNDVQIYSNHKLQKVDYLRRIIGVKARKNGDQSLSWEDGEQIPDEIQYSLGNEEITSKKVQKQKYKYQNINFSYDYLYIIAKQKTPKLLEQSDIDPYNNSMKYLNNLTHKNIFVFGADIFPTTHSFDAINYQAHIICANLMHLAMTGKEGSLTLKKQGLKQNQNACLVEYNGYTSFTVWTDNQNFIKFSHNYSDSLETEEKYLQKSNKTNKNQKNQVFPANNQTIKQSIQVKQKSWGCFQRCMEGLKRKWLVKKQIQMYYNLKSYGKPYYFFVPEFSQRNTPHCFVRTHHL